MSKSIQKLGRGLGDFFQLFYDNISKFTNKLRFFLQYFIYKNICIFIFIC